MADDADPFGTPAPWYVSAVGMVASAAVIATRAWLVYRGRSSSNEV
jgi:hypothetical protein